MLHNSSHKFILLCGIYKINFGLFMKGGLSESKLNVESFDGQYSAIKLDDIFQRLLFRPESRTLSSQPYNLHIFIFRHHQQLSIKHNLQ